MSNGPTRSFDDLFGLGGIFGADTSKLDLSAIRARLERKDCAGCGQVHADLRPWPPGDVFAHRYCGACRLDKALGVK